MEKEIKDLKQPFATQIRYSILRRLKKLSLETGRTQSEIAETALTEHLDKIERELLGRDSPSEVV